MSIFREGLITLAQHYWANPMFVIRETDLQLETVNALRSYLTGSRTVESFAGGLRCFDRRPPPDTFKVPRVLTELKPTFPNETNNPRPTDVVVLKQSERGLVLNRDGYGVRSIVQAIDAHEVEGLLELKLIGVSAIGVVRRYLMEDVKKLLELKAHYGDRAVEAALFVIDTSLPHPGLQFDHRDRTMNVRAQENQWPWPAALHDSAAVTENPPEGIDVWSLSLKGWHPLQRMNQRTLQPCLTRYRFSDPHQYTLLEVICLDESAISGIRNI